MNFVCGWLNSFENASNIMLEAFAELNLNKEQKKKKQKKKKSLLNYFDRGLSLPMEIALRHHDNGIGLLA